MPESLDIIQAVDRLTEEVKTLHLVMEEFRVCFEWAVQNDKLRGAEPEDELDLKAIVFDLREKLEILSLVVGEIGQVPKKQGRLFAKDAD